MVIKTLSICNLGILSKLWCGRGDLNPHAFRRHPLKMVCLPIPPLPLYNQSLIRILHCHKTSARDYRPTTLFADAYSNALEDCTRFCTRCHTLKVYTRGVEKSKGPQYVC